MRDITFRLVESHVEEFPCAHERARTKAAAERMQAASLTSSVAASKFDGLIDGFLERVRAA
jgi:hypothetical protein